MKNTCVVRFECQSRSQDALHKQIDQNPHVKFIELVVLF